MKQHRMQRQRSVDRPDKAREAEAIATSSSPGPLLPNALQLQKTMGNRATQQIVQQHFSAKKPVVQRQLLAQDGQPLADSPFYGKYQAMYPALMERLEQEGDRVVNDEAELAALVQQQVSAMKAREEKALPQRSTVTRSQAAETKELAEVNAAAFFKTHYVDQLTAEDREEPEIIEVAEAVYKLLNAQRKLLTYTDAFDEDRFASEIMVAFRSAVNPTDSGLKLKVLRYILTEEEYSRGHVIGGLGTLNYVRPASAAAMDDAPSATETGLSGRPDFDLGTQHHFKDRKVTHHIRHITAWHNIRQFLNKISDTFQDAGFRAQITDLLNEANAREKEATASEAGIGDRFEKHYASKMEEDDSIERIMMKTAFIMNSAIQNLWAGNGKENVARNRFAAFVQEKMYSIGLDNVTTVREQISGYHSGVASIRTMKDTLAGSLLSIWSATDKDDNAKLDEIRAVMERTYRSIEIDEPASSHAQEHKSDSDESDVHQKIIEIVRTDQLDAITPDYVYAIIRTFIGL